MEREFVSLANPRSKSVKDPRTWQACLVSEDHTREHCDSYISTMLSENESAVEMLKSQEFASLCVTAFGNPFTNYSFAKHRILFWE